MLRRAFWRRDVQPGAGAPVTLPVTAGGDASRHSSPTIQRGEIPCIAISRPLPCSAPSPRRASPSRPRPAGSSAWSTASPSSPLIPPPARSEEHTSELQSLRHLVCRLLLEKKKNKEQS